MRLRPIWNKFRLIRINERSAAGDPLEEFPKGNSLRRLAGAFMFSLLRADALLAATLVRSATADFVCKECVTALAEETRIGKHRKSDASIRKRPSGYCLASGVSSR